MSKAKPNLMPITIFSTVKLVEKTKDDYLSLFTVPQGQMMPGSWAKPEELRPEHTNIMVAGQFGSCIGDVAISRVRAIGISIDPKIDTRRSIDARFELHVCGRILFQASLNQIMAGMDLPKIFVARTDTFQGKLFVDGLEGEAYVRVEFDGHTVKREPCRHCHGSGFARA